MSDAPASHAEKRALQTQPIELEPPDLAAYRTGTQDVDYVHVFESVLPGPTVMINALTHGNEVCGAIAVKALLDSGLRPRRGRLILSFANVAAYARFDAHDPHAARFVDADFNRVWSNDKLKGAQTSSELARARVLRRFVDRADFLLDLHSMHESCVPLMVCGPLEKSVSMARQLGTPGCLVQDQGHPAGTRMRDYAAFGDATRDDGNPVLAPYDSCVLVMPSLRHARPGVTVVRLGRRTALPPLRQ